jgi:hypothetical protein
MKIKGGRGMAKKTLLFVVVTAAFLISSGAAASDKNFQDQIDELKNDMKQMSELYEARIAELEARLAQQERTDPQASPRSTEHVHTHDVPGECAHHGVLGDKVKVIGALDARFHNFEKQKNNFMIHEAKVGAQADITDWLFAYVVFTKHHGDDVELEEAYARFKFEQWGLSVKPGKFFVNFGPENQAHFFDRRTITMSAMHSGLFGHEPWADVGVQADWKIPVGFYSNLSFSVLTGDNAKSFGDGQDTVSNNNLPIVLDWTSLLETEYGLFRMGPSFAWGQWDRDGKYDVYLVGANAYYRLGNFDAQAELIYRYKRQPPGVGEENAYGYYFWGAYTVPLDYKYLKGIEFLGGMSQFIPDTGDRETRFTPQIGFILNDHAKLRATYEVRDQYPKDRKDNRFITQLGLAF